MVMQRRDNAELVSREVGAEGGEGQGWRKRLIRGGLAMHVTMVKMREKSMYSDCRGSLVC